MRRALCPALCAAALLGILCVAAEYPKEWISLFQPPYEGCPEIMMSIGCVANDTCFIPGGSNGVGFAVYNFNGQMNGNFAPLNDVNNSEINFILQVGVGGSKQQPKGAVGGAGLWYGLKYFVDATTLAAAVTTPFVETMDIRADPTGNQVLLINGFSTWGGLYSADAGLTYSAVTIAQGTVPNVNCTVPSYVAIAGPNTWYVVAASVPPTNNSGSSTGGSSFEAPIQGSYQLDRNLRYVKPHLAFLRKGADVSSVAAAGFRSGRKATQRVRRSLIKAHTARFSGRGAEREVGDQSVCGYGSSILKTTDGGATWTNFNFNTDTWSLTDIDCVNTTNCVSVGSGPFGSVIVRTTDGKNWSTVLSLPASSTQATGLNAVRYNPANSLEIWVGGGYETQSGTVEAVFYVSRDGGDTWAQQGTVNFVAEVMQLSFAPDGTGFAVGISEFQDSTVLRYTYNGAPATPAPAWSGNFSQVQCTDSNCSVDCQVFSFPQSTCLNLTGGGSATAMCDMTDQILVQNVYPLDDVCWGPSESQPMPLNLCFENQGSGSFYSICGPVTTPPQRARLGHGQGRLMHRKNGAHRRA